MWAAQAVKMGYRWCVGDGISQILGRPLVWLLLADHTILGYLL
jgi:hypothetical protein